MANEFTLESWLKDLDLTEEEMKVVSPLFSKPERTEKLKGSVLRQSEFSRRMQELDKRKTELEASIKEKEEAVLRDAQQLGNWKTTSDKTLADSAEALENERLERFKLAQKMERLVTQYGEDPKQWLSTEDVTPPHKKEEPKPAEEWWKKEDADRLAGELRMVPDLAAEFHDLDVEHYELFGKHLPMKTLVAESRKEKKFLRDYWAEKYKVEERREEIKEKAIEERINAKVQERTQNLLSEHKLPVTRTGDNGSTILSMRDDLRLEGRKQEKGASAVDAAIAAYNTGKYSQAKTA